MKRKNNYYKIIYSEQVLRDGLREEVREEGGTEALRDGESEAGKLSRKQGEREREKGSGRERGKEGYIEKEGVNNNNYYIII